jgi:hypothetical protein
MSVTVQPDPDNTPILGSITDDQTETFESYAAQLPETAQGFLDDAVRTSPENVGAPLVDALNPETDASTTLRKRVNVTKKVRKAMNRFKSKLADIPIMWFHTQAKGNAAWELDDEERELIKDSVDTVFDVLDVEVEIEPLSWTLTSVWWVISYPILAFAFLFLTKKSMVIEANKQDEAQHE